MGSPLIPLWSVAERRSKPALGGVDNVDYDLPRIFLEDYDNGERSALSQFPFDNLGWPESPNSLFGSDMNSTSSSPATSSLSLNTPFDGISFSDQQSFDLGIGSSSQSCPASITTSPNFPPSSYSERSFDCLGDPFYPSTHTPVFPPPAFSRMADTGVLDNCDPLSSTSPSSSSFQPIGNISTSTSGLQVPDDRFSGYDGPVDHSRYLMEPRPPDPACIAFSTFYLQNFPFEVEYVKDSLTKPSTSTLAATHDRPLLRGRRSRSVSDVEHGSNSNAVKMERKAPYSRSRSRTRPELEGGYRARVSTEAFKKVSDARRTAPAPHQCPICFDTFTRADGLQNHIDRHRGQGKTTICCFCQQAKTTISRHMRTCSKNPDRELSKPPKKNKGCMPT